MNLSSHKQQSLIENSKTTHIQLPVPSAPSVQQQALQCPFFDLPCNSHSKHNNQTLKNQQSLKNQTEMQLSSYKNLSEKKLSKQKKLTQITIPNALNTSISQHRGIRLSLTTRNNPNKPIDTNKSIDINKSIATKDKPLQQTQIQTQTNQKKLSIEKPLKTEHKLTEFSRQDKVLYHQLNPLSIDRSKYDGPNIKIGGDKVFIQSRKSIQPQLHNVGPKRLHIIPRDHSTANRTKVVFNNEQTLNRSHQVMTHYNYNGSYSQSQSFRQNDLFSGSGYVNLSQTILESKSTFIPPASLNSSSQKPQAQSAKITFPHHLNNPHYPYPTSTQIFQNIHLNYIPQPDLRLSTFSSYSSKYREYMTQELIPLPEPSNKKSDIQELEEAVRIDCVSVNEDQNQKINEVDANGYINFNEKPDFIVHRNEQSVGSEVQKGQRKGSFSQSFVVVENKDRRLENTRKIYLPSNIDSSSLPDTFPNDQITKPKPPSIVTTAPPSPIFFTSEQLPQLTLQLQTLSSSLHELHEEQKQLKSKLHTLSTQRHIQLQQNQKQLQLLRQVSQQRSDEIDLLKQMIKVKKICRLFDNNPDLKQELLQDENGWAQYIHFDGDFDKLDLSNDTNESQTEKLPVLQL